MTERGFLIHKSYTSIEVYRFKGLLKETNEILDRVKINDGRIGNGEVIQLEIIWKDIKEMLRDENLEEDFCLDIREVKRKVERISGEININAVL